MVAKGTVTMNFKDVVKKCNKDLVELKYNNERIILYKSNFEKTRTRYCFIQENASDEFVKCVLDNINIVGIEMDMQSKKYFIDSDEEPGFEHLFENSGYILHTNFCRLYFRSYRTFAA